MSVARDVTTVGTATLLSRLLGFFRDVGIAALLGAGALADAYFAALQIPNLFRRLLAEGALNSAFVPTWLRVRDEEGPDGSKRFGEEVLGAMFLVLGIIATLCIAFAPLIVHAIAPGFRSDEPRFAYALEFVRLSVPYVVIAGLVAVSASVLNAERRVAAAALGVVIFNAVLVTAVVAVVLSGTAISAVRAGELLSVSIVLAGIVQFLLVGGAYMRLPVRPRRLMLIPTPRARRFFVQAVPGVVAGGIPQLKLMAGAMVASSSPAAVSWLYYANRLYELPLGVVSIAISAVIVPAIAAGLREAGERGLADAQSRAFEIALGLALPSAVAFAALSEPIAGGLFERGAFGPHDTAMVAAALTAISAGLPGHVLEKVLGAVSFAHEDTRTPMWAALCGLAAAIVGAVTLFPHCGHIGVAAAIAMSGWVGATLLGFILWRRGWLRIDSAARRRLPRILLVTAAMGATIMAGHFLLASYLNVTGSATARVVTLFVLVVAGLGVYVAGLQWLGVAAWRDLLAIIRPRRPPLAP